MPITISYDHVLEEYEDELLEKFHAEAKDAGIVLEEYRSGVPIPRPKKKD